MEQTCKKLIEVAMPIKEISAESVRDKSIRHGHISTLHLWWARRPLPVCRAVIFASLVPDPLDGNCPQSFKDAIEELLGKTNNPSDPYSPYPDIPWTSIYDPMEDNLRNRLQMFIGKFTDEMQKALKHDSKVPGAKDQLSNFSLIKWDNKNNEAIINKARKLIWVAHNTKSGKSAKDLLDEFDEYYLAIKKAEEDLYNLADRHLPNNEVINKEKKLEDAIEAFLDKMPKVFDPFAGGGAIPLEAARLGCKSYGNDINPVAHIIQKGSLEFPQKYGKPIIYSEQEFIKIYGKEAFEEAPSEWKNLNPGFVKIPNRLSFDVEFYAKKLLDKAESEIGQYYPADENGKKPIAYYWARVGICSNPSCKAEVPLLRNFYLANTDRKKVHLNPIIKDKKIDFEIKEGNYDIEGWMERANLKCPCCGSVTENKILKEQFKKNHTKEKILAVIVEGSNGKEYRLPLPIEIKVIDVIPSAERPTETLPQNDSQNLKITLWGFPTWGQMFSPRQLLAMQTLVSKLSDIKTELKPYENDYHKAIITYLGILIDRISSRNTSFGLWHIGRETLEQPFGRQAIPMVFDYPESNIFTTSGGGALNQLEWLTRYIESECNHPFCAELNNPSSSDKPLFSDKHFTAVVTDPPYYDAIAYADLSDFFYVWLKRTLSDIYPLNFSTPQTPKTEECTALKHHHENSKEKAKQHFENKLTQILDVIERQTSDLVSIMFAHQGTEAWTTLCNSILASRMNITGSWATDTEMTGALKTNKSFLSSSVTVSARPVERQGIGSNKEVSKAIEKTVTKEVDELYKLGFRGADLLTACFGQAVSEFGKYEKVEKADGTEVTVAELLEMARESAFNALIKGFDGDDFTKFYIGWLQLYGFTENDFDDAAKFTKVGLSIEVKELFSQNILIKNGNKQTLGGFEERIKLNKQLGEQSDSFLIDQVHRAMSLHKNRDELLRFVAKVASSSESAFWRVLNSICEILPNGCEDHKQACTLLTNKDNLIRESRLVSTNQQKEIVEQTQLFI